jgi:hypothetical protein
MWQFNIDFWDKVINPWWTTAVENNKNAGSSSTRSAKFVNRKWKNTTTFIWVIETLVWKLQWAGVELKVIVEWPSPINSQVEWRIRK